MCRLLFVLILLAATGIASPKNPIISNGGVNDPHIHIFEGRAYLYATHDRSGENKGFAMDEWGVWSSDDLVNWHLESILKPENTYIGEPFDQCWATDAAYRNGKYYFYFSEQNRQTGVVVGNSPTGPWEDPLGKPLLPEGLTSTHSYDPAVFLDDDGEHYIIFGVWDFYIARLNHDMISLAETPRKIEINDPRGPYNQEGENQKMPTDDKPFLHKYDGKYYLSWGAFYACSDNLSGPYEYMGAVLNECSFAPGYAEPTWPNGFLQGRHGSFFQWHNQWYFAYCDISQSANRYFRDTFISYVHFKENGEIAPLRVDGTGVGEYDANQPKIDAEDYFKAEGFIKMEFLDNHFCVTPEGGLSYLIYPNIHHLSDVKTIQLRVSNTNRKGTSLKILNKDLQGRTLLKAKIPYTGTDIVFETFTFNLKNVNDVTDLCFVLEDEVSGNVMLDYFSFSK